MTAPAAAHQIESNEQQAARPTTIAVGDLVDCRRFGLDRLLWSRLGRSGAAIAFTCLWVLRSRRGLGGGVCDNDRLGAAGLTIQLTCGGLRRKTNKSGRREND
jgi:hypothetical protein